MDVTITEKPRIKRASAARRHGCIHVTVPRHWPRTLKHEAVLELVEKVLRNEEKTRQILRSPAAQTSLITLATQSELENYVHQINRHTLNVSVKRVRIGRSRYSQLAQMNIKTQTMSISRYCLHDVPESALRYLIVHELAHCHEVRHNKRFWAIVAHHIPDYLFQSQIIKAFHRQAVESAEQIETASLPVLPTKHSTITPLEKAGSWLSSLAYQLPLFHH